MSSSDGHKSMTGAEIMAMRKGSYELPARGTSQTWDEDYRPPEKAAADKTARDADNPWPDVRYTTQKTSSTKSEGDRLSQPAVPLQEENMLKHDQDIGQGSRGDDIGSMVPHKGGPNDKVTFTKSTKSYDGGDK
jgi:hypothetical protein